MKNSLLTYTKYIILSLVAIASVSCKKTDEPQLPEKVERMVLVYQVANNSLNLYSDYDYQEMLLGAGDIGSNNRLLVYRHNKKTSPMLVEIKTNGRVDTLHTYSTSVSSVDITRMTEVIKDAKDYAKAEQNGLVLWSHGSGWIQDGMTQTSGMKRSFGDDGGKRMNSTDLAVALSDAGGFDWIYFDCCYMMSVETLYELRNTAKYFAGSVTELQLKGMPYHLNLKYFFAPGETDLIGAAQSTYDYFLDEIAQNNDISNNYCTMSVVKASALEALADATRAIYENAASSYPAGFTPQQYSNVNESNCNYFDFGQYAEALAKNDAKEFRNALAEAVVFKAATPYLRQLPINHHSGISTYILRNENSHSYRYYDELAWYHDVASALKF